jgi:sulfate transport system ATP-binding protein
VGAPRELYDQPATPFVMSFLGPVTAVGDVLVRPHDLTISLERGEGREAQVSRVIHLGFEVRVELELADDGQVSVQLTKAEAEQLELSEGDIVYVSEPSSSPGLPPASRPSEAASPLPDPRG